LAIFLIKFTEKGHEISREFLNKKRNGTNGSRHREILSRLKFVSTIESDDALVIGKWEKPQVHPMPPRGKNVCLLSFVPKHYGKSEQRE